MTPEEERQVYEIGLKPFLDAKAELEQKRGCMAIFALLLTGVSTPLGAIYLMQAAGLFAG